MPGELSSYFVADHRRLENLLERTVASRHALDEGSYAEFRAGLLKHIGMEEKILLPAVRRMQQGVPHRYAGTLRLEHGAFASLLVPPASRKIVAVFFTIMNHHNELEEGKDGLYLECERLMGNNYHELMLQVQNYPEVPVMPHVGTPEVLAATRRAVARAGYDFDAIEF